MVRNPFARGELILNMKRRLYLLFLIIIIVKGCKEIEQFEKWCLQQNIEFSSIKIVEIESYGRGVIASKDIQVSKLKLISKFN